MRKRITTIAMAAGALLALGACAKSNQAMLPDSVFAADLVPVYKNCELTDQMGNESWGDEPESYTKGNTWFFKTKASQDELVAFYEKQFPNAERQVMDDGGIEFTLYPADAVKPYESVSVVVRDGSLQIGESFQPRRKAKKS